MGSDYCEATGKVKYANPQRANHVRKQMGKRLSRERGRTYRCPHCKMHHLTSREDIKK